MTTRKNEFLAWGGFVEGKLYVQPPKERPDEPEYDEPRYAIFPTRNAARRAYEDVRRVKVIVLEQ